MRNILIPILLIILTSPIIAQPTLDLGIKAGINNSNISLNIDNYTSESITKAHFGAFGRIGWGRIFIQPEAYFSAKGGDLDISLYNTITSFDYSTLDIPVLLGVKIIKGETIGLHAVAGPVFNIITANKISGPDLLTTQYYKDHFYGFQYGLGVDVFFLTLDARMEHGKNSFYSFPDFLGKNKTFMISVGFKLF